MCEPLYKPGNVSVAYQLNWSLAVFWHNPVPPIDWLEPLRTATEPDGVRILEHRLTKPNVSQFLLSTKPHVSPAMCVRSVKGRLQYLLRERIPRPFRRNYDIQSVGSANESTIQQYVATQIQHHPMADPRVQAMLKRYQFSDSSVNLSQMRRSSHGEFLYNVQLVLVHRDRMVDVCEDFLGKTLGMIRGVSGKKGHLLSRVGLLADHLHKTIGCGIQEAPLEVGLTYLNNLAYAHGMRDVYEYSFYVGTFGRFDLNVVRLALAGQSSLRPDVPDGGGKRGDAWVREL